MYLYRVCFPSHISPRWEDLPLPGGSNTMTGYWTPHLDCAAAIYRSRADWCEAYLGGGTYARVYRIPVELAVLGSPAHKTGHYDGFDRDEVFVARLIGEPEDVTDFVENR